jgi:hypothetical protein
VHELGVPASSDAIASLLIGLLLGLTAIGLARPLADLLIGQVDRAGTARARPAEPSENLRRWMRSASSTQVHCRTSGSRSCREGAPVADLNADELAAAMDESRFTIAR